MLATTACLTSFEAILVRGRRPSPRDSQFRPSAARPRVADREVFCNLPWIAARQDDPLSSHVAPVIGPRGQEIRAPNSFFIDRTFSTAIRLKKSVGTYRARRL